jgi:hypothetical protein
MNDFSSLVGKTIVSATVVGIEGHDDKPYLDLVFTDGTTARIVATYGGYTGRSEDEYPAFIELDEVRA